MNLNNTIRKSMWKYPSLFSHRIQVLNHLYLTNGNGYEWRKGQLTPSWPEKNPTGPRSYESAAKSALDFLTKRAGPFIREMHKDTTIEEQIIKERERHVRDAKDSYFQYSYYPICKYACICNIPDDIKLDWLEGAIEVCQWMVAINEQDHVKTQRKGLGNQIKDITDEQLIDSLNKDKQKLLVILEDCLKRREKFFVEFNDEDMEP